MDDLRMLIAYRYSVGDVERWPTTVVRVFAEHLRRRDA